MCYWNQLPILAAWFASRIDCQSAYARNPHTIQSYIQKLVQIIHAQQFSHNEVTIVDEMEFHQQNVNQSGSHRQTSQTLPQMSPVLRSNFGCSLAPLQLCTALSDSATAFSCAPESTCSYRSAFTMPQDVMYRIVQFWSCRDLCAGLRET
jgi:hypothetical protein